MNAWTKVLEERSLRRESARRRRELSGRGRWQRMRHGLRERPAVVLLLAAAAILLLPTVPAPVLPGLAQAASSSNFLETLWQVQASVIAITFAVVVFALQSFSSSHRDISLQGLLRGSRLNLALYSALYSLALIPAVLLGWGRDAPGGSAAFWATFSSSLIGVVSLLWSFRQTLDVTNQRALQAYRLRRFRTAAADYVDTQVLERLALGRLRGVCEEWGVDFAPYIAKKAEGSAVGASRQGVVRDINLKLLRSLAMNNPGGLRVATYIGQHVGVGSALLVASDPETARRAKRLVTIDPPPSSDGYSEALSDLHEVAMEAISNQRLNSYRFVQEAWASVLVAFPREWARYGQVYDPGLDAPLTLLGRSRVDSVMQQLYEEAVAVVGQGNRELAFELTALPYRVAREALELGAMPLVRRMLKWFVTLHLLAVDKPAGVTSLLADRTTHLLFELCDFHIWRRMEEVDGPAEMAGPMSAALAASQSIAGLLRGLADRGQLDNLRAVDRRWANLGSLWDPSSRYPDELTMRIARRDLPAGTPQLVELETQYERGQAQVEAQSRIARLDRVLRFGLCFWAIHRLSQSKDRELWSSVFAHFADWYRNPNALVETVGDALEADNRESADWSSWLLEDLPEDEVHRLGTTNELIKAAVAILLMKPQALPAAAWIRDYKDQWKGFLAQIRERPDQLEPLVSASDIEKRVEDVSKALTTALLEQDTNDAAEVRRLPLSEGTAERIATLVRAGWERRRWLPLVMRAFSSYVEDQTPVDTDTAAFGRSDWLPKSWFVEAGQETSWEGFLRDYGQSISSAEPASLVPALQSSAPPAGRDGHSFGDLVRSAVAELRSTGYDPSVILVPHGLDIERQLNVGLMAAGRTPPPAEWNLPPEARVAYRGVFDNVHVVALARHLKGMAYVVDLGRWATWQQRCPPPGHHCLQIVVRVFDETDSLRLAREHRNLMRREGVKSLADRAKAIQGSVEVRAHEYFSVKVNDPKAARRILFGHSDDD